MGLRGTLVGVLVAVSLTGCGGALATDAQSSAGDAATPATPPLVVEVAAGACLQQVLPTDASGMAQCSVIEALPSLGVEEECLGLPGLSVPDAQTLAAVRAETTLALGATTPLCLVTQLPALGPGGGATCATSSAAGWCYLTGEAAQLAPGLYCGQSLAFSPDARPAAGATMLLMCP